MGGNPASIVLQELCWRNRAGIPVASIVPAHTGALDTDTSIPLMLSSALGEGAEEGPQQQRPSSATCRVVPVECSPTI